MAHKKQLYQLAPSGPQPTLVTKNITANGTYTAASETPPADGYSEVTVAVPAPPNKLKTLVDGSITEVTADDLAGITAIKQGAFEKCDSLTAVAIPNTVITIGQNGFIDCTHLLAINIPNSVTTIGNNAFRNCSAATALTISNALTAIPYGCFQYCRAVTGNVIIPASVASIDGNAFYGVHSASSFTVLATTPPTLASPVVFSDTNDVPIYVPAESVDTYKAATNWSALASRIQAIPA